MHAYCTTHNPNMTFLIHFSSPRSFVEICAKLLFKGNLDKHFAKCYAVVLGMSKNLKFYPASKGTILTVWLFLHYNATAHIVNFLSVNALMKLVFNYLKNKNLNLKATYIDSK